MIKIASWNVNSLKIRLEQVLAWLEEEQIDILAVQETKLTDENFPLSAFAAHGYHTAFAGQKTYNGVAVISRLPLQQVMTDLPLYQDPQRRIVAVSTHNLRLINLYVPNGTSLASDKFLYKLAWLDHIKQFIASELDKNPHLVVLGDFNIAPQDADVHDPHAWLGNIHVSPEERAAFQALLDLGLYDSFRLFSQPEKLFSWWDYRAGGFRRNHGLRIDHILLSASLKPLCQSSTIDIIPRKAERPSDHAPVIVTLDWAT